MTNDPHVATIFVPDRLNDAEFEVIARRWEEAENAELIVPGSLSLREIEPMAGYFLGKLPRTVAFAVLSELAEGGQRMRSEILDQIFDRGDTACKVSICLRVDLDSELESKCRNSPNEDVREHYELRIRRHSQID